MGATALLYGIQAAAGIAQGVYGYRQMQEAKEREELLRAQGLPQMQTPQEYFELYQNASRSRAFEQEKAMTQSVLASNLATLQQAGSRALIGAAPAATLQAQRGLARAAERDFQRQQQALGQLAAAQARTAGMNFQVESQQYARDLLGAQAGYQAGAETMFAGLDMAAGAAASAGLAAGGQKTIQQNIDPNLKTADQPVTRSTPQVVQDPYLTSDFSFGTEVTGLDPIQRDYGLDLGIGASNFGNTGATATFDPNFYMSNINIGVDALNKAQGGSVTTPGKYTADHSVEYDVKTKSGKTIATVTGDETLVFNPEQRRFLKKVIGKLMKGQTMTLSKSDTKAANQTFKAFKK